MRGTAPAPSAVDGAFGGSTTCVEIPLAADHRLLIDCGTGLRKVEEALIASGAHGGTRFDVLLTHYHLDHLMGLSVFAPLYDPDCRFTFYGAPWEGRGVQEILEGLIGPPWSPLALRETAAKKRYVDLDGTPFDLGCVAVATARLRHPQGVTAYRLERGGRRIVFATDCERGAPEPDERLAGLAGEADVLVHDAQYTPEEYVRRYRGWGHSSWRHAVEAARACAAGRLVLFHHDPRRSDEQIDEIVRRAGEESPAVEAAREGGTLPL